MTPALLILLKGIGGAFVLGVPIVGILEARIPGGWWRLYGQEMLIVALVIILVVGPVWLAGLILAAFLLRGVYEVRLTHRHPLMWLVVSVQLISVVLLWRALDAGWQAWVLWAYIVVETGDSTAYLVGRSVGRRKPFPKLSPNKTLAGFGTGFAMAMVVGIGFGYTALAMDWTHAIGLTTLTVLGGFAGDLAVSAVKRTVGVKDFPPVLSGHGGVLDIYDAAMLAVPATLLIAEATGLLV